MQMQRLAATLQDLAGLLRVWAGSSGTADVEILHPMLSDRIFGFSDFPQDGESEYLKIRLFGFFGISTFPDFRLLLYVLPV